MNEWMYLRRYLDLSALHKVGSVHNYLGTS